MRLIRFRGDPEKQCRGKRGYRTKKQAKQRIRQMQSRSGDLVVYLCPHCGGFHIGHDVPKGVLHSSPSA